ncbi:hypothetical protein GCK72_003259 [Caenorhabditis remanei]|uniref:Sdz-33 F-box domain-containing protein n=1 Tax=Caenorhabditis remanei TaxID=31234 RepID=A0A6A5HXY3_CAERE|nr:hypothetical protein GCK72_003259 [Caenorhabditis remanei]KAF1771433.1 hypothetical protein GCK72_003259 [Caenorhabditis remanei]
MSLSKPFPLLRLPRLPLFKVFDCIGLQEQFYLSICSSKAKYAIKFYPSRQKFFVAFHFTNNFTFYMSTANSDDEFQINAKTHTAIFRSLWRFLSSIETSSKPPSENNAKRLLLFLVDVFNTPAICLNFEKRRHEIVTGFINYIHSQKLNIQRLDIMSKKGEDEIVEFVLDNCRNTPEVYLECPVTTRFKYLNKSLISKFNLDKLTMDYAEWVTTGQLTNLFINCKHLVLHNCSTGHIKVNQFIKKWMNGPSQLKHAWLTFKVDLSMADIMRGIPSTVVPTEELGRGRSINTVYRIQQQKSGRMSQSKPFPLLRLPRLPLFKVFNDIGVQERFYLSICSSKAKYAIKFYNERQKFSVNFNFTDTFAFSLKTGHHKFWIDFQTHIPIFGSMWTFLSSVYAEAPTNVKRLLMFLVDVFNTPAISLNFEERPHDFVSGFINFIQSVKLNIHRLKIKSNNEKDVEFILDNCREGFSELHLNCPMTTLFEYLNKPLLPKFNLDVLEINYAGWVTTRHLTKLFMNCKYVKLDRCNPRNINVKQFIQEWKYGYSQLNHACLTFSNVDFSLADIMRGIPSTVVPVEEMGREFRTINNTVYRIKQQKTGREANVYSDRNYISIKLKIQSLKIESKKAEDMEFVLDNCREGFSEIHLDCPGTTRFKYLNKSLFPKFSVDKLTNLQLIYEWIYGCSQLKYARLTFGHDQTKMRLVESDWLGTRLPRVDRCYGSKYLADIMKTIPSTILPTKEMGWEFGLLDTKVYRIRQQNTGREANVFSDHRTIGITDSPLAYPNYP